MSPAPSLKAPMKLRFLAKDDGPDGLPLYVSVPGARPGTGDMPRFVGRKLKAVTVNGKPVYPSSGQPYECDEDSDAGRRLVKLVKRDNSLTPADEYTARVCGLEFKAAAKAVAEPSAKSAKGDK